MRKFSSLVITIVIISALAKDECGHGVELGYEAEEAEEEVSQSRSMFEEVSQSRSMLQLPRSRETQSWKQVSDGDDIHPLPHAQVMVIKQIGLAEISSDEDMDSSETLKRHEAAVHALLWESVTARLALDRNVVNNSFAAIGVKMEARYTAAVEHMMRMKESQRMPLDPNALLKFGKVFNAPLKFGKGLIMPADKAGKLERDLVGNAMAKGLAEMITKLSGPNPHFTPKEIFKTVKDIAGPAIGLAIGALNPLLGIGFTFAMSLIEGLIGNQEERDKEDPQTKLYKKIMKEVKDLVSTAVMQQSVNTFKVELAEVKKGMQLLEALMSLDAQGGGSNMEQAEVIWYVMLLKDVSELRTKFWGVDCVEDLKNKKCREWHEMCIWNIAVYLSDLELGLLSQILMMQSEWGVTLGRRMVEIAKHARKHVRNSMYVCKEARFKKLRTYQTSDPMTIFHDTFYSPVKHFKSFNEWMDQVKYVTDTMEQEIGYWVDHFDEIYFAHNPDDQNKVTLSTTFGESGLCQEKNKWGVLQLCMAKNWITVPSDTMFRGMWIADAKQTFQSAVRFFSQSQIIGNDLKFSCYDNWQVSGFDTGKWYSDASAYAKPLSLACNPGFFVNGLYIGHGTKLDDLNAVRCCKPISTPHQWGSCEFKNVFDGREKVPERLDQPGNVRGELWYECPAGMMMAGMDRGDYGSNFIDALYRLKCCSLSHCPAKCYAARTAASKSCQTCVDPKTSQCIKDGNACPVGSLSCSACDGVISTGCSAKLYAYPNFQHGNTHSVYLNANDGRSYCDPPEEGCQAFPRQFGTGAARDRGHTGNLIGSMIVEGSQGCVLTIDDKPSKRQFTFGVGEYTGAALRLGLYNKPGYWPYYIPHRVSLDLQCHVIIYNGPEWKNPLPALAPGKYTIKDLYKLGLKGKIEGFKIEKSNGNNVCGFRMLNAKQELLHPMWQGPKANPQWWWWQRNNPGRATPAYVEVLMGS